MKIALVILSFLRLFGSSSAILLRLDSPVVSNIRVGILTGDENQGLVIDWQFLRTYGDVVAFRVLLIPEGKPKFNLTTKMGQKHLTDFRAVFFDYILEEDRSITVRIESLASIDGTKSLGEKIEKFLPYQGKLLIVFSLKQKDPM